MTPSYVSNWIRLEEIDDTTSYLQFGQQQSISNFFTYVKGKAETSALRDFPDNYLFSKIRVNVDSSHNINARQTYDLLMFLGDIGGL